MKLKGGVVGGEEIGAPWEVLGRGVEDKVASHGGGRSNPQSGG